MSEKVYVLVKFRCDWADEFFVKGHKVFTEAGWTKFQDALGKIDWAREFSFGTNEYFEWANKTDYLSAVTAQTISEADCRLLHELNLLEGGTFIDPTDY